VITAPQNFRAFDCSQLGYGSQTTTLWTLFAAFCSAPVGLTGELVMVLSLIFAEKMYWRAENGIVVVCIGLKLVGTCLGVKNEVVWGS
jgi:hypothetical protein